MSAGRRWLYHAARLGLGATFLVAGLLKIPEVTTFAGQIAAYRLLPPFGNYLVAAALPWLELLAGGLLLLGFRVRAAALLVALLNLVFVAALVSAWSRGLSIDCGCFRPTGAATSIPLALLRDLLLLVLTGITLALAPPSPRP